MELLAAKELDAPDELRSFSNGRIEVCNFGETSVGRVTFEPGFRWSEHVQPIAGTTSCELPHVGYALSGGCRVRMDDGREIEIRAGEAFTVPAGHDCWVVGDEAFVALDFSSGSEYARSEGDKQAVSVS